MRYALNVPNFGPYADPHLIVDLAVEAEQHGWDAFFLWDHMLLWDADTPHAMADPWVLLAAVASATDRIRLGPMVVPVARRRPWKLARESVSLDRLSGGRVTMGAGLGNPPDTEFAAFGEDPSARTRARRLDEGLEIVDGMWSGEPFEYHGEYYDVERFAFLPKPVQKPRIPVWIAGKWPNRPPFRRAARWDGVFPMKVGDGQLTPEEICDIVGYVTEHREASGPFDVSMFVIGFLSGANRSAEMIERYAEAGVTWIHDGPSFDDTDEQAVRSFRSQIREGPPGD
jgi:alkanesulfonate monooxygenase SsuD/methylene tetrahydromethanopterin reductase-like flavin-dependent oxidoreductase (luciferase family)